MSAMAWLTGLFTPATPPPPPAPTPAPPAPPPSVPELVEMLVAHEDFTGFIGWRVSVEPGTADERWAWRSKGVSQPALVDHLEQLLEQAVATNQ